MSLRAERWRKELGAARFKSFNCVAIIASVVNPVLANLHASFSGCSGHSLEEAGGCEALTTQLVALHERIGRGLLSQVENVTLDEGNSLMSGALFPPCFRNVAFFMCK